MHRHPDFISRLISGVTIAVLVLAAISSLSRCHYIALPENSSPPSSALFPSR